MATDMAKVRKFEDGLKLSIRGKIVGFLLQDMDFIVRMTVAIEREIDDARSIRAVGASRKRKKSHASSRSGKKQRTFSSMRTFSIELRLSGKGCQPSRADDMFLLSPAWIKEDGLPIKAEIPGTWDTVVPGIGGTGTAIVCSFSPRYGSEEPVSVTEPYASTFSSTGMLKGPNDGLRSGTGLTGQDFGDPGVCLRHCTTG